MPTKFPDSIVRDPLTMLAFYDDDINTGKVKLDAWQKELLIYLGKYKKPSDSAIEAMVLAANGSGKSKYIIAPFAIWVPMAHVESLTIITTASGLQLDAQNLRYCTRYASKINEFHKAAGDFPEGVFDCQYRKFKNKVTESFLNMFATDETGKAEGWHPISADGEFVIIVDEGKTLADEIYEALERCTGHTRRLETSSAGKSSGTFHEMWHKELPGVWKKRVTAFDCGHIKLEDINKRIAKYGLMDPLIRSSIFSEFTSLDEQVVISRELLLRATTLCTEFYDFGPLRAGLDLAAGGDENSCRVWKGNKFIAGLNFRMVDTSKTVRDVIDFVESFGGKLLPENVWADDGGVGRGILDNFREKGYKFNRILNQARPSDTTRYANRGTELWFSFKRFIEEYQVLFEKDESGNIKDKLLFAQLTNRYFSIQSGTGKIALEPKQKAKKEGHPSPDRADADILAWCPYMYPLEEINGKNRVAEGPRGYGIEEVNRKIQEEKWSKYRQQPVTFQPRLTPAQMAGNSFSHSKIFGQGREKELSRFSRELSKGVR